MRKSSFARAMDQIAIEDDQQKQDELHTEQKRALMRKIRKVCLVVVGAALVGFAFAHRVEFGRKIQKITGGTSTLNDFGTGERLNRIRDAAQKHDAILNDLAGK